MLAPLITRANAYVPPYNPTSKRPSPKARFYVLFHDCVATYMRYCVKARTPTTPTTSSPLPNFTIPSANQLSSSSSYPPSSIALFSLFLRAHIHTRDMCHLPYTLLFCISQEFLRQAQAYRRDARGSPSPHHQHTREAEKFV